MREIHSDPEVLFHAVVDGINVFVRDVLIPRHPELKELLGTDEILQLKYEVAKTVSAWKTTCWINDEMDQAAEPDIGPDRACDAQD